MNSKETVDGKPQSITTPSRNNHPCCKPLKLCQYLATLLLPPAEYSPRRILVPFAGSGSEMIGAMLAGWDEVAGIELLRENVEIAQSRLRYWSKVIESKVDVTQLTLPLDME